MGITFNPFTGTLDFIGGAGGGGGTPSAPDTSVQFNDGGTFGGDAALTWDKTSETLAIYPDDASHLALDVGSFTSLFSDSTDANPTLTVAASVVGAFSDGFGQKIAVQSFGTANISTLKGLLIDVHHHSSGTLDANTAVEIATIDSVGGVTTTVTGLLVNDVTAGATNYAIKTGLGLNSFGDDIQLATGKALRTDTTTAHTALVQAYDVDGAAYKTFATLTNGNVPSFTISQPVGGLLAMIAPTTDPGVTGALWNDNGAPAFSA